MAEIRITQKDRDGIEAKRSKFEKMINLACKDRYVYEDVVDKHFKLVKKGKMYYVAKKSEKLLFCLLTRFKKLSPRPRSRPRKSTSPWTFENQPNCRYSRMLWIWEIRLSKSMCQKSFLVFSSNLQKIEEEGIYLDHLYIQEVDNLANHNKKRTILKSFISCA